MRALTAWIPLVAVAWSVAVRPEPAVAAQRAFVSASGVDNATCSLASPCRSFAAAITTANAGGEVVVLDSAGYGPVTITKSVSIITPPGIYAGITVTSDNGVTINAPGETVVLRGLSINGQGGAYGILAQQAARVRIENCVVSGMAAVGIHHTADNGEMIVLDTVVRDSTDGLGLVASNASITLDHVKAEHNAAGGFYIAPTPGSAFAKATIVDSVFVYNGANGVWADTVGGATTNVHVERTVMSDNGGNGFRTNAGAGGSFSQALLRHNAVSRNGGDGVVILATFGFARAAITDNSLLYNNGNGIALDGDLVLGLVSGNTGIGSYPDLWCVNDAALVTFGNNAVWSRATGGSNCVSIESGR